MSESVAHLRYRICERPLVDGRFDDAYCETCGVALHWSCWLEHAATPAERRQVAEAVEDEDARGLTIRCGGCSEDLGFSRKEV